MLLKRLADISIEIYAQTSVMARATRSMSIGLRNCDHEVNHFSSVSLEVSKLHSNLSAFR